MITSIALENVRGVTRQIAMVSSNVPSITASGNAAAPGNTAGKIVVKVCGRNGERKSTIADAIAFIFTGADSSGSPVPLHLISEGKDKMTVTLATEKATITRSLTRKKTQTLKMQRAGQPLPSDLTQEQMTKLIGSKDAFLSSFMSGYFMGLSDDKRMKVLQEFVPAVDKFALVEEISGVKLEAALKQSISIEKRSDLAKAPVVLRRSQAEKKHSELAGAVSVYAVTKHPGEEPKKPQTDVSLVKARYDAYEKFTKDTSEWTSLVKEAEATGTLWKVWDARRVELESNLALLPEIPKPQLSPKFKELSDATARIESLKKDLQKPQKQHASTTLPQTDSCPTCGQVVGTKHRERVCEENKKLEDNYQRLVAEYDAARKGYEDEAVLLFKERTAIEAEHLKTIEAWDKESSSRRTALSDLRAHKSVEPVRKQEPSHMPVPPPTGMVTQVALREAIELNTLYTSELSAWKNAHIYYNDAMVRKDKIVEEMGTLGTYTAELKAIEGAFDKLDQVIFERNQQYYKFTNHELIVNDGHVSIVREDGLPYEFMSTGQRIVANSYLCEKLAKAFKVSFIFIDNYDLVSTSIQLDCPQVFEVNVTEGVFGVTAVAVATT